MTLRESRDLPKRLLGRLLVSTDTGRQDRYWDTDTVHREVSHPVVAGFARQRWQHLARTIPLHQVRTVLDVGSGSGFSTHYAPGHLRIVACDRSLHMLSRNPGRHRIRSDATCLPFADSSFDLVFCWEMLHHLPEPWRALHEMERVSRGWVMVFEPNPLNPAQLLFALLDREHRWVLRYSRAYMKEQFRKAGLSLQIHQRVGSIFPNRTPRWLYPGLRTLPFRMPLVGISQLVIARKGS